MTLAGSRSASRAHRYQKRPAGMRLSGFALLGIAVLIVASAWFAGNSGIALMAAVFVAANVAHKAAWSLWAVSQGRIAGTKVLAMIAAVVSIAWIIMSWFLEGGATTYFWMVLVLGLVAAAVAAFDATISPDEDRRLAHEPRAPEDTSAFEQTAHGHEHLDGR